MFVCARTTLQSTSSRIVPTATATTGGARCSMGGGRQLYTGSQTATRTSLPGLTGLAAIAVAGVGAVSFATVGCSGREAGEDVDVYTADLKAMFDVEDLGDHAKEVDGIILRPLAIDDYDKGFLEVLAQLTTVGSVTREDFEERFTQMAAAGPIYNTIVAEDVTTGKVIAAGSLIVESKFIHELNQTGHIEDIVVDEGYRGRRLGKRVIHCLLDLSRTRGCYKTILDCAEKNVGFYERCGLERKGVEMAVYNDA